MIISNDPWQAVHISPGNCDGLLRDRPGSLYSPVSGLSDWFLSLLREVDFHAFPSNRTHRSVH
jgi:hypothetical protein